MGLESLIIASQVLQTRWQEKMVRIEESSSCFGDAGRPRRMISSSSGMAKTLAATEIASGALPVDCNATGMV